MGCHTWIYKKLSSFTKDEMNKKLQELVDDTYQAYVYSTPREAYCTNMLEDALDTINHYKDQLETISKTELIYYNDALENNTIEKWYNIYDNYHNKMVSINNRINEFINDDTLSYNECKDIIIDMLADYSADYEIINDELYVLINGELYFRCYEYNVEPIFTYAEMKTFLTNIHPNMISLWKDNEEIKGYSNELDEYLKDLYKNNDIFIEFI